MFDGIGLAKGEKLIASGLRKPILFWLLSKALQKERNLARIGY